MEEVDGKRNGNADQSIKDAVQRKQIRIFICDM